VAACPLPGTSKFKLGIQFPQVITRHLKVVHNCLYRVLCFTIVHQRFNRTLTFMLASKHFINQFARVGWASEFLRYTFELFGWQTAIRTASAIGRAREEFRGRACSQWAADQTRNKYYPYGQETELPSTNKERGNDQPKQQDAQNGIDLRFPRSSEETVKH